MKSIKHHAKTIIRVTPKFVHGMVAGAFIGVIVVFSLRATNHASALSITSPRDCDNNSVINCGALTTSELQSKYSTTGGAAAIYTYFGISATDISSMGATASAGAVHKDGRVTIENTVVATNAVTAGRLTITGSTKVTSGGQTFYTRPPSVSFNPESINAYVVMKDGQFKYAILGACGNPVKATPIPKETPKTVVTPPPVVPTPPTPTPTPTIPTPPATTTPSTQTPPSTPMPVVTIAATTPQTLPETGPGAVFIIALLAVIGGYLLHMGHRHINRKRQTTRQRNSRG